MREEMRTEQLVKEEAIIWRITSYATMSISISKSGNLHPNKAILKPDS